MKQRFVRLFEKTEQMIFISAIRKGFIMMIPVLMIGSFSLVLNNLPISAYQTLIKETLFDGRLSSIFVGAYNATFGILSIYVTAFISISYAQHYQAKVPFIYGAPLTSLICYAALSGFGSEGFTVASFGARGMFVAILSAVFASWMYTRLAQYRWGKLELYTDGADVGFNHAFSAIAPAAMTCLFFVSINMVLCHIFHVDSFYQLFSLGAGTLFHNMGRSLWSMLLYVFLSSLLWFFGIHGTDVLEGVSLSLFAPGTQINADLVAAGMAPTEIYTKNFFEIFVVLGGCGATLCLLAAMLIFTKRKSNRSLSRMAALPMIFNINETMVFGLPIVYNPYMFLPFILTPVVLLLISVAAVQLGLVPIPHFEVNWTTPIILSGYLATGSAAGAVLQVFNLIVGMGIYAPFIRLYDREQMRMASRQTKRLVEILQESEESNIPVTLTELSDSSGAVAKMLALDLHHALQEGGKGLDLFYQPQYDNNNVCIGAEALLRWNHPSCGMIYPPLVIKLAQETAVLGQLERYILEKSATDAKAIQRETSPTFKMSGNVTSATFQSKDFDVFLMELHQKLDIDPTTLCLEVTEQIALDVGGDAEALFARVKGMGYKMAIDDFSMGHTSLKYLQGNQFDIVKIDGGLVRDINTNPRSREIIASIIYLAKSLGFLVCAEFVENEEIRKALEEIGCNIYQGWLYSPALPLETFLQRHGDAARRHAAPVATAALGK